MDTVPVRHRFSREPWFYFRHSRGATPSFVCAAHHAALPPEDFGLFAYSVRSSPSAPWLPAPSSLPSSCQKIKTAATVVVLSLVASVGVVLLTALLILVFGGDFARWIDFTTTAGCCTSCGVVLAGLSLRIILGRPSAGYGPLAASVGQSVPQTVAQIGFGVAGLGPMGSCW